MRVLALTSDGFGGYGGIAQYNRDLLTALCHDPEIAEVVELPRLKYHDRDPIPDKLTHHLRGLGGRLKYALALFGIVLSPQRIDLVVCCHINLIPFAWFASRMKRAPLVLTVFGIDAWQPPRGILAGRLVDRVDGCIAISRHTRRLFLRWSNLDPNKVWLLPNAIHLERYHVGPKSPELLSRHDLIGKKVLMTFGRLAYLERYKGFDEVLEALPEMLKSEPDLAYVIAGDGSDRGRLEAKAKALGVAHRVRFTGMVSEEEKAAYYRLADAYVMPSRGEGFGFVFLEAMACGIPSVASCTDGSRDAALDGALAEMVTPGNPAELVRATFTALQKPKQVPEMLRRFAFDNFCAHIRRIMRAVASPDRT